jgi:hypothetical protein
VPLRGEVMQLSGTGSGILSVAGHGTFGSANRWLLTERFNKRKINNLNTVFFISLVVL